MSILHSSSQLRLIYPHSADFTLFFLWSVIEANVAILCCCMPTLLPVITQVQKSTFWNSTRRLLSFSTRSRSRNTKGSEQLDDSYSERSLKGLVPSRRSKSNGVNTNISAISRDDDLERQMPPPRNIVVHSDFSRYDNYERS